ncbi:titin [Elysia marginata]|uniref:Titin n=1 Tax=Elysia marginata TaxID=1093978 RepID=A0AAV4HTV7_9GAST|nr:titin [Elysia marginata]
MGTSVSKLMCNRLERRKTPLFKSRRDAPARILTKPEPLTVLEGEPLVLTFTLEGLPQPTVEWFVEGSALLPDDNHTIEQPTQQEVTLKIPKPEVSDSANYSVTVTNETGSDTASVEVTVIKPAVEEEITPDYEKPEESKPVGQAPEFLLSIKTQTVLPGETADFVCEVTGEPSPHLSWVYNGRVLEDEGRYMIFEEEGLHHLEVYEVCPEDVGEYTVTAQNDHGQVACSAELQLKELPEEKKPELQAPKFIVAIETVEATEGETATFTCKATGKPSPELLWYKNDKLIAPEDSQFTMTYPGEGESSLVVVDLRPEHDGTYTCEAKNEAGSVKCKAELFVDEKPQEKNEAPEFIKVPEKVTAREHDNAKFLVKVIGQPKPSVTWLRDNQPLQDTDLYHLETFEDNYCFEIKDTEMEDAGPYTCVAENTEGKVSVNIPLVVNAIPRDERLSESPLVLKTQEETTPPKFIETFKDISVIEGDTLTLTCRVTGLPRPEITWFRNDEEIEKGPSIVMKHEEETVKLKIPATTMEQDGLYRCVATNSAGTDSCEARVDVQGKTEAPVFTRPLNNREVREGRPPSQRSTGKVTLLRYHIIGVKLYLNDQPIETGVHFKLEQRKGLTGDMVHNLSIDVTQVKDAGTVKAVATNKAGEATSEARLDVEEKKEVPKFIKKMETIETVENNPASFSVVVSGKPKPHVTWIRGDEELTASDNIIMEVDDQTHTLTINKVSLDDAKVFTARAKNPAGQVACNARLKIVPGKKPTFVRKMSDALVPEHGTAKFDCKVTGTPAPQVTWSINDKELEPSDNIVMDFSRKDSLYSLTIKDATPDLAGEVKAVASNSGGEVLCTALLDVRGKAPTFVEAPVKCTVLEGYTAEFRCVVDGQPAPTVAWSKGKWMKIQDGGRYTVTADLNTGEHILQMRDIKNKDAGTYTVTASNEHGSEQVPATLMVTDKMEEMTDWKSQLKHREATEMAEEDEEAPWQVDLRHVEVEEQKSPSPEEEKRASPPEFQRTPYVPFQKRERPELEEGETLTFEMAPREREELEQFQRAAAPLTAAAVPEDEDSLGYTRPVKPVELAETDEQAFIRQKAKWQWTVPLQDQAVKERETAKFQCDFSVPNVRVDWTVAGEIVESSPKYAIQSDQHTHTLLVTKCRPKDATQVSCSYGDISTEANLVVQPVPAEFTITLEDTAAKEGTDAVFTCSTDDDEAPVQWFVNGQPISPSDRYRITSDGTDHTLTIADVQPGEDCEVTVVVGDNKSSAKLTVQEIEADFLVPLKDQTAKENSTVEFECTLSIPAKPEKVRWVIDGKEVDTSDRSRYETVVDKEKLKLIIHTVSMEDAGEVTVKVGDKDSSAKLTVEELEAEFTVPLSDQTVPEASNVEFSCELNIDTDDVAWFLDEDKLSPSPKDGIDISKQGLQHRLSIEDVSPDDTGVVKVVAKGKSSEAKLVVEELGPDFAVPLKDLTVIEKATAEMVCELTKDVDKVRWFVDDIELPEGDRIQFLKDGLKHKLVIKDACIDDEGVVTAQIGDKKCTASLFVQGT